jgi:NADPH2 dehydrogenase
MKDPLPTFSHLVSEIKRQWSNLVYIHVTEPRQNELMFDLLPGVVDVDISGSNDRLREIWAPRPYISCGGYDRAQGIKTAEEKGDIIAYGRPFIANVSSAYIICVCTEDFIDSPISLIVLSTIFL